MIHVLEENWIFTTIKTKRTLRQGADWGGYGVCVCVSVCFGDTWNVVVMLGVWV